MVKSTPIVMIVGVLISLCIFASIVTATTAEEWNERGCRFFESGDCEKAIECFDRAIGLNPQFTDAYLNRGLAFWHLKQNERAIADLEKVIESNSCSDLACRALNALNDLKPENGYAAEAATPSLAPPLTEEVYKLLQENPEGIIPWDCRLEVLHNSDHMPVTRNLPVRELERRLGELGKSKIIPLCCQTGGASALESDILLQNGFEPVFMMIGRINAWNGEYPTMHPSPKPPQAPPFTLTSIDGTTFSLTDYRGEVVVLTLIAPTCKECCEEMLVLEQLREAYPDIAIITVCVDLVETEEDLRDFKENYKADWLFARDTDNLYSKYQGYIAATPTIVIITPEGYISFREVGVVPLEDLVSAVESAASGEWAPTSADISEEWPQIPGFSATVALAIIYARVLSRWLVKRRKSKN